MASNREFWDQKFSFDVQEPLPEFKKIHDQIMRSPDFTPTNKLFATLWLSGKSAEDIVSHPTFAGKKENTFIMHQREIAEYTKDMGLGDPNKSEHENLPPPLFRRSTVKKTNNKKLTNESKFVNYDAIGQDLSDLGMRDIPSKHKNLYLKYIKHSATNPPPPNLHDLDETLVDRIVQHNFKRSTYDEVRSDPIIKQHTSKMSNDDIKTLSSRIRKTYNRKGFMVPGGIHGDTLTFGIDRLYTNGVVNDKTPYRDVSRLLRNPDGSPINFDRSMVGFISSYKRNNGMRRLKEAVDTERERRINYLVLREDEDDQEA